MYITMASSSDLLRTSVGRLNFNFFLFAFVWNPFMETKLRENVRAHIEYICRMAKYELRALQRIRNCLKKKLGF